MLTNTAYKGFKAMGVRRSISEQRKKKLEAGTSIIYFNPENDVAETPAIVTPEVFEAAQRALKSRKSRSSAKDTKKNPPLLKGLIVCPRCGRGYTCTGQLYTCCSGAYGVEHNCRNTSIRPDAANQVVWAVTKEVFSEAMAKQIAEQKAEPIAGEIALLNQEIEGYRDSIQPIKGRSANLSN